MRLAAVKEVREMSEYIICDNCNTPVIHDYAYNARGELLCIKCWEQEEFDKIDSAIMELEEGENDE